MSEVRDVNTETCAAWVIIGDPGLGGMIPCSEWGEGQCFKDSRAARGIAAIVAEGVCLADVADGIADEPIARGDNRAIDEFFS